MLQVHELLNRYRPLRCGLYTIARSKWNWKWPLSQRPRKEWSKQPKDHTWSWSFIKCLMNYVWKN